MKDWNPEEWQGRRKDQVEYTNKMVTFSLTALVFSVIFLLVF